MELSVIDPTYYLLRCSANSFFSVALVYLWELYSIYLCKLSVLVTICKDDAFSIYGLSWIPRSPGIRRAKSRGMTDQVQDYHGS
jgi:hypothetical protein